MDEAVYQQVCRLVSFWCRPAEREDAIQDVVLILLREPDIPIQRAVNRVRARVYYASKKAVVHLRLRTGDDPTRSDVLEWAASLPPLERLIVERVIDDYTPADIAKELRCEPHRVRRIIRGMRERLTPP